MDTKSTILFMKVLTLSATFIMNIKKNLAFFRFHKMTSLN